MGVKISELPSFSSPLTGDELIAVVQDSITSNSPLSSLANPLTAVGGMLARSEIKSLTGNWNTAYTAIACSCCDWNDAYTVTTAYQSVSSNYARRDCDNTYTCDATFNGEVFTVDCNATFNSNITVSDAVSATTLVVDTVNAGLCNTVTANYYSAVAGGFYNVNQGFGSSIIGGVYNDTAGTYNAIVGGCCNCITGNRAFVGSGQSNCNQGDDSSIVAGCTNTISSSVSGSSVLAGSNVTASANDTAYAAKLVLTNLPTSDSGLAAGSVYIDPSTCTLKIV